MPKKGYKQTKEHKKKLKDRREKRFSGIVFKYRGKEKEYIKKYNKEYKQKNREKVNRIKREFARRRKKEIAIKRKNYYQKNRENLLKKAKEYYQRNKKEIRERRRDYFKRWQKKLGRRKCVFCGRNIPNTNKKYCNFSCLGEHRKEISYMKGEKNYNWQGGLSFEPYGIEFNKELKEQIRKRDGYACQCCCKPQKERRLSIHHIDYNKKKNNPSNLISLCLRCHLNTERNRMRWKKYFEMLVRNRKTIRRLK